MELLYASAANPLNRIATNLARALAPKDRAKVITPGPVLTDIGKASVLDTFRAEPQELIPRRRPDIVGAAPCFASASRCTTGAVIKVDGGPTFTPG